MSKYSELADRLEDAPTVGAIEAELYDTAAAALRELEAERDELKSMLDWHVREPVPDGDPVQELGEYLADNLDEDKRNHVEPLLNGLRAALQEGSQ